MYVVKELYENQPLTQSHNNLTGHQISDGLKGIIQARK